MEVIPLAGYTEEEKLQIAKRYLVPRQIERNGLKRSQVGFSDTGLREIITSYTREAGVRSLEREVGSVCRKVALDVALGKLERKLSVTAPRVRELLGRPASIPTSAAGPPSRASPPASRGRPSAATCCSSRRARCPARAS